MNAASLAQNISEETGSPFWQRFVDWLYLPNSFIGLTRRLAGLEGVFILVIVWVWAHGGPGPINVPAWRIGPHLLHLPAPPEEITRTLFVLAGCSSIAMMLGSAFKLWPFILAGVIGYFGSMDWMASGCHFIVLEWLMLLALLLERPGRSPTRRLIQVSTVLCYFYTATQKALFPDFVAGYSFETMFGDGWSLGSAWKGILPVEHFGHGFWVFLSLFTIAIEYLFVFGLCFPRTRRVTLLCAIFFHLGIAVFLDKFISIFSLCMCACLSTFIDEPSAAEIESGGKSSLLSRYFVAFTVWVKRMQVFFYNFARGQHLGFLVQDPAKEEAERSKPLRLTGAVRLQSAFSLLLLSMMVLIPLRVYYYPGRPLDKLSFFDRSPWSYCMYLARQETSRLEAQYQDEHGNWHTHPIDKKKERWGRVTGDNELYALADYVFAVHPEARRVRIESDIVMNGRLPQEKTLERDRDDHDKEIIVRFLPTYPEIRLQKRVEGQADL
ncbi:MAG TPA: hypothetical protein V6C86_19320 [Oculatellaceae cyanobacterium]